MKIKDLNPKAVAHCRCNSLVREYFQEIRDLVRHDQREREAIKLALIEGERSGVSERSVTDIARQAKRRLQGAQV